MIGLDTNVLVRYLAQDDAKQAALATRLIERTLSAAEPGYISLVVLAELCWVLQRLYSATGVEILDTVDDLLASQQFALEQRDVVQTAVQTCRNAKGGKAGFADALVLQSARHAGCTHTLSFDKAAIAALGMRGL